jgi:GABA(A) receptor-associated protein
MTGILSYMFGTSQSTTTADATIPNNEYTRSERVADVQRVRMKHPTMCPLYIQKARTCSLPDLEKKKYLVPMDSTVGYLVYIIRKKLGLAPSEAIYLCVAKQGKVGGVMPSVTMQLQELYDKEKDDDGFLYVVYQSENVFGYL